MCTQKCASTPSSERRVKAAIPMDLLASQRTLVPSEACPQTQHSLAAHRGQAIPAREQTPRCGNRRQNTNLPGNPGQRLAPITSQHSNTASRRSSMSESRCQSELYSFRRPHRLRLQTRKEPNSRSIPLVHPFWLLQAPVTGSRSRVSEQLFSKLTPCKAHSPEGVRRLR